MVGEVKGEGQLVCIQTRLSPSCDQSFLLAHACSKWNKDGDFIHVIEIDGLVHRAVAHGYIGAASDA